MTKTETFSASAWADWAGFSLAVMTMGMTELPVTVDRIAARDLARAMSSRSAVRETSATACQLFPAEMMMAVSKMSLKPPGVICPSRTARAMAGVGQTLLVQGHVGTVESQDNLRAGQGLGPDGPFVLPLFQIVQASVNGVEHLLYSPLVFQQRLVGSTLVLVAGQVFDSVAGGHGRIVPQRGRWGNGRPAGEAGARRSYRSVDEMGATSL